MVAVNEKSCKVIFLLPIFAKKRNNANHIHNFWFKFKFYSNDHTPIHVHVEKGGARAKYQLFPIELVENQGFKIGELKLIESIIEENVETISEHWNNFFNNKE